MPYSYLSHLRCSKTGEIVDADQPQQLSPVGAPLLASYDLEALKQAWHPAALLGRPASLWRYHELLPVRDPAQVITLGEGFTPLLPLPAFGKQIGIPDLWMKDESIIPTGSFKARGAAVGVSRARELGITHFAMPTNGNAGAAWALYGARAGLRSTIVMPQAAPAITRLETSLAGARLYLVDGLISDAGRQVAEAVAEQGLFDASTLKEPYRIEGKKTMGLEIAEQLGWTLPDVILYPHRRRGWSHRHLQGAAGVAGAGLGQGAAAATGGGAGERLRPHRPGLAAGGARIALLARFPDPRLWHQRAQGAGGLSGAGRPLSHRGVRRRGGR